MIIKIVIILTAEPFVVIIDAIITLPPTAGKITKVTLKKFKHSYIRTESFTYFFLFYEFLLWRSHVFH